MNIPYQPGATLDEMVALFQSKGIKPDQVTNFVPVTHKEPDGSQKVVMYPESHERKYDEQKEHRRMEEFDRRIQAGIEEHNKQVEKATEQGKEITELKSQVNELKDILTQFIMSQQKPVKVKNTDLNTMHWKSFQKKAKDVGIEWSTKDSRAEVIAILEAKENDQPS